ncbi:MAG: cyclic nucleotide-binding domain-containing protein [Gammaproteobacteria bacterium]|nr:cyclic nucleotide-binding domain-containing protein [Gammaproteobacteria bacterium]
MFSDSPVPQTSQDLWQHCHQLLSGLIAGAPVKTASLTLPTESTLDFNNNQSLYLLKDGILKEFYNDNLVINHEAGDLVGIQCLINNNHTHTITDFAVIVDEYDIRDFLAYIAADSDRLFDWNHYLASLIQSFQLIICDYKKDEVIFHPEIRQYEKAHEIIAQGATDNEVYTLITGSAEVIVDGIAVGEIKRDEIFGAIAALTGTARTAQVVALSDCTVLVVPADKFHSLLSSRPETVTKLIEDMARSIVSGNEQIVNLSSQ